MLDIEFCIQKKIEHFNKDSFFTHYGSDKLLKAVHDCIHFAELTLGPEVVAKAKKNDNIVRTGFDPDTSAYSVAGRLIVPLENQGSDTLASQSGLTPGK